MATISRLAVTALTAGLLAAPAPAQTTQVDDVVARGAALTGAPLVDLTEVLAAVAAYADTIVTVEGTVTKVCQMKGCWMELVPEGARHGVRVTFEDYAFFVPTDSAGRRARLEGRFETNVFSKDDADHLIHEGVELTRNPDGTATEVSFVASGVELRAVE